MARYAFIEDLRHNVLAGEHIRVLDRKHKNTGVFRVLELHEQRRVVLCKLLRFALPSDSRGSTGYSFDSGDFHSHDGMQEVIEIFLMTAGNAEAIVNMQDRFGSTPLALAVSNCLEVSPDKKPPPVKTPQKRGAVSKGRQSKRGTSVLAKGADDDSDSDGEPRRKGGARRRGGQKKPSRRPGAGGADARWD